MGKVIRDIRRRVELNEPLRTIDIGQVVKGDMNADRFVLELLENGKPLDLGEYSVSGMFLNAIGVDVPIEGSIEGNVLTATLGRGCYDVRGMAGGFLRIANGDATVIRTVIRFTADVLSDGTGIVYDPDKVIGNIAELMAKIAAMEDATRDARLATQEVREALGSEGNAQVAAIREEGAAQIAAAKTEGAAQILAIEEKGERTRQSIPEDWTTLDADVRQLKNTTANLIERTTETQPITDFAKGYIDTSVGVGEVADVDSPVSNNSYVHKVIPCKAGDQFFIIGAGGSGPRLWCFVDGAYVILYVADASKKSTGMTLTAEQDGYFIYNSSINGGALYTPTVTLTKPFSASENGKQLAAIEAALTESRIIDDFEIGYIDTTGGVGAIVDTGWVTQNNAYVHKVISCKAGDRFSIIGFGTDTVRLWCFLSADKTIVSVADGKVTTSAGIPLVAEQDGYFVYNASVNAGSVYTPAITQIVAFDASREHQESEEPEEPMYLCAPVPDEYIAFNSVTQSKSSALTLDEVYAGYDALVAAYPNYVTKTQAGMDASGAYPVWRYDFTRLALNADMVDYNALSEHNAPKVIVSACVHGDEKPCARALLNVMTAITNATTQNDALGWLRTNVNFSVIPVLNPYGYVNHQRGNYNGVDLNRNYHDQWEYGDSEGLNYKGASPLSEAETQIVDALMQSETAITYIDLHTHGNFTSYDNMTYFETDREHRKALQRVGFGVITELTKSGWASHDLPINSGYIGMLSNPRERSGRASYQAKRWGAPVITPECMYRYYDGRTSVDYSEKVNCMNAEFVANTFVKLAKEFVR